MVKGIIVYSTYTFDASITEMNSAEQLELSILTMATCYDDKYCALHAVLHTYVHCHNFIHMQGHECSSHV